MKTSISDDKVKEILIDGINSGANYILNKTNFYEHIRTLHKIEKQRCLRLYDLHYNNAQIERNNIKTELGINQQKEAVKTLLLDKLGRMKIAEQIALDEKNVNSSDRLKALDYLSKIEGDYASTKTDITSGGEKIATAPPTIVFMDNENED
jgi:hypothetical protein